MTLYRTSKSKYEDGYEGGTLRWTLDGAGAYLPHQCDSWRIGGPVEIRALMADLEAALAELEPARGEGA